MKVVRVNKDGSMNDIELKLKKITILKQLEKSSISKGTSEFCELYKWTYDSNNIICYGWYDGDAGFENKHELIPNGNSRFLDEESSEKLLFGDLFLVCFNCKNKVIDYCVSDYAEYYNIIFDGFDSCSENDLSDDNESNEDNGDNGELEDNDGENLNNFIVNDNKSQDSDDSYEYIGDDELDEDENDY